MDPNTSSVKQNRALFYVLIGLLSFFFFSFISKYLIITSIGLAFSLVIVIDFINQLGRSFPLKQLIVMLASLQWIVGAKISYEYGKIHYKYYMYVEEQLYMDLVVPAVLLLFLGLFMIKTPNFRIQLDGLVDMDLESKMKFKKTADILMFLGLSAFFLNRVISSPGLAFTLFISSLLIFGSFISALTTRISSFIPKDGI